MSDFSTTTESLLVVLHALKVHLRGTGLKVGITKTNVLFPNAVATVYVKNDSRALYVYLDTRYSHSFNEYVIRYFKLVEFDKPKGSADVSELYQSPDYTTLIHEDSFLESMSKDVFNMVEIIKKELI